MQFYTLMTTGSEAVVEVALRRTQRETGPITRRERTLLSSFFLWIVWKRGKSIVENTTVY